MQIADKGNEHRQHQRHFVVAGEEGSSRPLHPELAAVNDGENAALDPVVPQ